MTRLALLAVLALATTAIGCGEGTDTQVIETPDDVIAPQATDSMPGDEVGAGTEIEIDAADSADASPTDEEMPVPAEAVDVEVEEPATPSPEPTPGDEPQASTPSAEGPEFVPVTFEALKKQIADSGARYTMVDCWASWCGPCKENFPHVLEMNEKYGDKGLKVASLSFDKGTGDPDYDAKQIAAARAFLGKVEAGGLTNYLFDVEDIGMAFEAFDISTIPAVFVFDSEGKEIRRYTWDDPNNQFTYEQVEAEVSALLEAEGEEPGA